MSTTTMTPPTAKPSPCGCHEQPPAPCTCCGITCFERPNYFCGHLLTDADLSLEQKYVVEKNKLYHRAIDGYGIACGLKVTCDHACQGHVLVRQGFAIDDCGNDIVVCETARFDVIGTLQKKGMLVVDEDYDDCKPKKEKRHCKIKQCFYLTICYDESKSNYETPFQSSCTSGPKQCLPTRTREGYRFDVTDELPTEHSYLKELEKRFQHCFEIHRDGKIGQIMSENIYCLKHILHGTFTREAWEKCKLKPCDLFCTLRAWFLNHLKVKPDEYNCGLFEEVHCLSCPSEYEGERQQGDRWDDYSKELGEAFRKLVIYIERYQFDCAINELVFSCEQPCEAHCVVLGTVEVIDGKLVRVCNTPRKYLWAPGNLLPVLFYDLLYAHAGESHNRDDNSKASCCPSYDRFLPEQFIKEFECNKEGRYLAATSGIRAVEAVISALRHSLDFTDTNRISQSMFTNFDHPCNEVGVIVTPVKGKDISALSHPTVFEAFARHTLAQTGDAVQLYAVREGAERAAVITNTVRGISRDRSIGKAIEDAVNNVDQIKDDVKSAQEQAANALDQVEKLRKRLDTFIEKTDEGPPETSKGGEPAEEKPGKKK